MPAFGPLMATMPSGREIHAQKTYVPPVVEQSTLEGMRAPPDHTDTYNNDNSSDEDNEIGEPVGAFPGTKNDYASSSTNKYY